MANPTEAIVSAASATPPDETTRKPGAFHLSQELVTAGEAATEAPRPEPVPDSAGDAQPAAAVSPAFEDLGQLPASYQEDTLFLVARDPRWLFAYWDFDWAKFPASGMRHGYTQFFLKIARSGGAQEAMVEIQPAARNWYVPVNHPGVEYTAEIGFFDQAGAWRLVIRSGPAHTPADTLAPDGGAAHAAEFATVPAHLTFERLLEMVQERMAEGESLLAALGRVAGEGRAEFGGSQAPGWNEEQKRVLAALLGNKLVDTLGLGSEEIDQLLRRSLEEKLSSEAASGLSMGTLGGESFFSEVGASLFSAVGASWSAQPFSVRTERGFYLHVNAEIIFYGGTQPDATVWIGGKQIALSPDGSFRYHFTLPDGDYEIPVVAQSPDGVETRSAALSFKRGTERVGEVGATGQPAELSGLMGRL